jgi:hypothetical protein
MSESTKPDPSSQGQKRFHCTVDGCPKRTHAYTRQEKLNDHVRSQYSSIRVKCPDCLKDFVRLGDLKKHVLTVHEGQKGFICALTLDQISGCGCGRQFTKKSSLNRHLKIWPRVSSKMSNTYVSELMIDPVLMEHFAERLEAQLADLQLPIFPGSRDGLLARCAAIDPNDEGDDVTNEISQPHDGGDDDSMAADDTVEDMLYKRLVSLFRSRRPRTCVMLLEEIKRTIQKANVERVANSIDRANLFGQMLDLWRACGPTGFTHGSRFVLKINIHGSVYWHYVDSYEAACLMDSVGLKRADELEMSILERSADTILS